MPRLPFSSSAVDWRRIAIFLRTDDFLSGRNPFVHERAAWLQRLPRMRRALVAARRTLSYSDVVTEAAIDESDAVAATLSALARCLAVRRAGGGGAYVPS